MEAAEARRAVVAATSTAASLGLDADAAVVLNDSNRLVVHLQPCDVVARVTPVLHHRNVPNASAQREIEVAARLAETDSPVAPLEHRVEPRVHERDDFQITLWTYLEPVDGVLPSVEYAGALQRLHAGLRQIEVSTPHVMDRVLATQRDAADRAITPDLTDADRGLLVTTLRELSESVARRSAAEQLLHGEPHPWNVHPTALGPVFIDFENTARGPVEYDLAWVPAEVSDRYPGVDPNLLDDCRGLVLGIIAMHRWRVDDRHPSGRESGVAFLHALRSGPPWHPVDEV